MKKYIFALGLFSLLLFSCGKMTEVKDEISFRKYKPYLVLQPADSVTHFPDETCDKAIPFPLDSVVSESLDINKDGQDDFKMTYTTSYQSSPINSCENYSSTLEAKALLPGHLILVNNVTTKKIQVFEKNEEIPNNSKYAENGFIYLDQPDNSEYFEIGNGNKYLGIRLKDGETGWIKVFHQKDSLKFTIMEHAYNKTTILDIKAGQIN